MTYTSKEYNLNLASQAAKCSIRGKKNLSFDVAGKISAEMDKQGISRSVLAKKLCVSPAYVTKLLRGHANLTIGSLAKIASVLGCECKILIADKRDTKNSDLFRDLSKELNKITAQIVHFYKPQKIILFGSMVSGRITEGSDIDLFIVKRNVPRLGVDRIRELQNMIRHRFATDLIVYTPEELSECVENGDPFVKHILENGRTLFEAA